MIENCTTQGSSRHICMPRWLSAPAPEPHTPDSHFSANAFRWDENGLCRLFGFLLCLRLLPAGILYAGSGGGASRFAFVRPVFDSYLPAEGGTAALSPWPYFVYPIVTCGRGSGLAIEGAAYGAQQPSRSIYRSCFSPDGTSIYYSRLSDGETRRCLFSMPCPSGSSQTPDKVGNLPVALRHRAALCATTANGMCNIRDAGLRSVNSGCCRDGDRSIPRSFCL